MENFHFIYALASKLASNQVAMFQTCQKSSQKQEKPPKIGGFYGKLTAI